MLNTIAVSAVLIATTTAGQLGDFTYVRPLNQSEAIVQYLKDYPQLIAVAKCESGLRQWDDTGMVLQGRIVSQDRGGLQINEHYHKEDALALGYDIEALEGNLGFGIYLYKKNGLRDWSASSKCWKKLLGLG